MDEVQHFTYGWINPVFAYLLSVVGSLVGLHCTTKARASADPHQRAWLLVLAAGAIGGTGIWVMHFMAMMGFSVPGTTVRYDLPLTGASFLIAVCTVGIGLFIVGFGRPSRGKLLVGGVVTGVSVAFMHYTGMSAMRLNGHVSYDSTMVGASYVVAVVAATVALWCTVVVTGIRATVGAALIMGAAVCGMHYLGMAAVRVHLTEHAAPVPGTDLNWFVFGIVGLVLLTILVAVVGTMLAATPDDVPRISQPTDIGPSPVDQPLVDRQFGDLPMPAVSREPTIDMRAMANAGTRFVPRSAGAGGGLRSTRGGTGGAGARPPGR